MYIMYFREASQLYGAVQYIWLALVACERSMKHPLYQHFFTVCSLKLCMNHNFLTFLNPDFLQSFLFWESKLSI